MNLSLGICHYCHLRVPATALDGSRARENFEYKRVHGEPETMWHFLHPLYPNCFEIESRQPDSVWYVDPRQFAGDDPLADSEEGELYLPPSVHDDLPEYLSETSIGHKIAEHARSLGFGGEA